MSHRAEKSTGRTLKRAPAAPQANITSVERRPNSIVARSAAPDQRRTMIAEAAYYLALQRNFEPGHDVQDWLLAERQIDGTLA